MAGVLSAKSKTGRWEAYEDDVQCQTGEEILCTQFFNKSFMSSYYAWHKGHSGEGRDVIVKQTTEWSLLPWSFQSNGQDQY